jgi:hypothetical protein
MGIALDGTAATLVNLGNMMVLREGDEDARGRKIALIDHDFNLSALYYERIEENLKRLRDPEDDLLKTLVTGSISTTYSGCHQSPHKASLLY